VAWRLGIRRWPAVIVGGLILYAVSRFLSVVLRTDVSKSAVRPEIVWPMLIVMIAVGGLFVLISSTLIAQPFWRAWTASRTVYAITNRRVLIILASRLRSPATHEFRSQEIRRLVCFHRAAGTVGDILLWRGPIDFNAIAPNRQSVVTSDWRPECGFLAVRHPDEPERLIRELHLRPEPIA
jgi:hypothetical protein